MMKLLTCNRTFCAFVFAGLFLSVLTHAPRVTAQGSRPSLVGTDAVIQSVSAQTESLIGQLVARQAGQVATRLAGLVTRLHVDIGDRVNKGDVIAELDLETVRARRDVSASKVESAKAIIETRRTEIRLAQIERDRLEDLKGSASVARAQYDDAVQKELISQARLREAQASLLEADANLRLAAVELAFGNVTAPYSGYVVQKNTEVGSYLNEGSSVVSLIGDEGLEIEVDVPVGRLKELKPGTSIEAVISKEISVDATVRAILPQENPRTRTRTVRLTPVEKLPAEGLADGQSIDIKVPVAAAREIVSVHKDAVVRRGSNVIVYVVDDGLAKLRNVTLGISIGDRFEILNGLAPGDQAIIRGNERLRPDTPVEVKTTPKDGIAANTQSPENETPTDASKQEKSPKQATGKPVQQ